MGCGCWGVPYSVIVGRGSTITRLLGRSGRIHWGFDTTWLLRDPITRDCLGSGMFTMGVTKGRQRTNSKLS